jgi:hypothetical protein
MFFLPNVKYGGYVPHCTFSFLCSEYTRKLLIHGPSSRSVILLVSWLFFCEITQCNSDIDNLKILKSIIYGTMPTNLNPLPSMAALRLWTSVPPLCRTFWWRGCYLNTRRTNLLSCHSCLSHQRWLSDHSSRRLYCCSYFSPLFVF